MQRRQFSQVGFSAVTLGARGANGSNMLAES